MSKQSVRRRQPQPTVEELTKEFILLRNLRSGDKLPTEGELADELGVSRNTVREALRSLQALGIVDIRHGHGTYVRDIALTSLADSLTFWGRLSERDGLEGVQPIAEVREVLETNLIGVVIHLLQDSDLHEMDDSVQEMRTRAAKGLHASDADRRFHEILYRPLDNWVHFYLMRAFWDAYTAVSKDSPRPKRDPAQIAQQHQDILDALKRRDAEAAQQAMTVHFDNALRRRMTRANTAASKPIGRGPATRRS